MTTVVILSRKFEDYNKVRHKKKILFLTNIKYRSLGIRIFENSFLALSCY